MRVEPFRHGEALNPLVGQVGAQGCDVPAVLRLAVEDAIESPDDAIQVVPEVRRVVVGDLIPGFLGVLTHLGQRGALASHKLYEDPDQSHRYGPAGTHESDLH
ncbi:hypothetical protein [Streptomyces sp. NPDC053048]|uniref:hypothetical protein n=1 Tax=Streptomyces sp. NPDC053048 TaxID=3365694 RepID=UPI0037D899C9